MKQQEIILCYETDKHHSISSRALVYVGEDLEDCIAQIDKHRGGLSDEDKEQLRDMLQTQGHEGDTEWYFDKVLTNAFCD